MYFNTSHNVDTEKAKKITAYQVEKILRRHKRLSSDNISVWIKNLNPPQSAGVERFSCKVELRHTSRNLEVETEGEEIHAVVKHTFEVFHTKLGDKKYDQKTIRDFKRKQNDAE